MRRLALALVLLVSCSKGEKSTPAQTAPVEKPAEPPPPPRAPDPMEKLVDAETFAEACAIVRPLFEDTVDEMNKGAYMLALWGGERLR